MLSISDFSIVHWFGNIWTRKLYSRLTARNCGVETINSVGVVALEREGEHFWVGVAVHRGEGHMYYGKTFCQILADKYNCY